MKRVVVVGAGPAGVAAAAALARTSLHVTLIDEAPRPGGQIHRAPAAGLELDMGRVLGAGFAAWRDFHAAASSLCARIDYRPRTLVWSVHGGAAHLASASSLDALPYDALVLATGATDRVAPAPGWTLPGIFTLGAAQTLLKDQGCLIGGRVIFSGSSPLLYLAALQYLRAGGDVAAVIDTTPFPAKLRAVRDMLAAPRILGDGLRYLFALRRRGIPVIHGAAIERFEGEGRVAAVVCRTPSGAHRRIACDAAAYGHGLRPETQLAELAGCALRYDPAHRLHFPDADIDGRAGNGVYVAGDGGAIGGAEAAAISGALAGAAVLHDFSMGDAGIDIEAHRRKLRRLRRFQRGLATAFVWPRDRFAALDDNVTLCRCENVSIGEARAALRQPIGAGEANRIKAATRCGMGRCQGRYCGPALAEVTAVALGRADIELDRLRAQAPVKPLPIAWAERAPA